MSRDTSHVRLNVKSSAVHGSRGVPRTWSTCSPRLKSSEKKQWSYYLENYQKKLLIIDLLIIKYPNNRIRFHQEIEHNAVQGGGGIRHEKIISRLLKFILMRNTQKFSGAPPLGKYRELCLQDAPDLSWCELTGHVSLSQKVLPL